MRFRTLVLVSAAALAVSGCAAPIIGALTLGQLSTIAGGISTLTTGKGLADHALSLLTGKDCSIAEGILRKDRKVCEVRGSLATRDDFKGVFAYFEKKNEKAEPGDQVLANYARARGEELAQGNQEEVKEVTPATASAPDLRLLPFVDDDANGTGGGSAPANLVMAANTTPVAAPEDPPSKNMKFITYRDEDADGTPRIVSRYVYMMEPIPDAAPGTVAPAAVTATAAPVAAPSVAPAPAAPAIAAAPPPPSSPAPVVVASQPPTAPAPNKPASLMAPAPAAPVAPAKPVVAQAAAPAATPTHYQPATPRKVADGPPQPIVYWYLSGR